MGIKQSLLHTFSILKNRNYLFLFMANVTKELGSVIGLSAFTFYLLQRFSSQPAYASFAEMMYALPTLLVFFLVGVFADRFDRQKIALYCDVISAALTLLLIGAIYIEVMPLVFFILFLRSAVIKFFHPAQTSLVQGILTKEQYPLAAGLNQMVSSIFVLFGTGIGLLVFWTLGVIGALAIDFVTFCLSAWFIRRCSLTDEVRVPNGQHKLKDLRLKHIFSEFFLGAKYILTYRLLLFVVMGVGMFGIINGGFSVIPIFTLKYKLAPDTYEELTFVVSLFFGISILVGSIIAPILAQRIKLYQLFIYSLLAAGIITLLGAFIQSLLLYILFATALGFCVAVLNVAVGGWLPQLIDPKMRGRVSGIMSPLQMFTQTLTLGLITLLYPNIVGIEFLYYLVSASLLLVGTFYLLTIPRLVKQEESANALNTDDGQELEPVTASQ